MSATLRRIPHLIALTLGYSMVIDFGPLQPYFDDPDISEIMVVNGRDVWVEEFSQLRHVAALSPSDVAMCTEQISRLSHRRIDNLSPVADASLPDGSRACVVISPIAVGGTTIAIRKFPRRILPLAAFGTEECSAVIRALIHERLNVVVSGATSSGKTTFVSSATQYFEQHERVVCAEDTSEIRFAHPHVVRLQTRTANAEGHGEVTLQDLVRTSLRLRPDRLIVGEVRGSEAIDMLLALSSGHRGCWSTVHAVSADLTLDRLATIVLRGSPQWSMGNVSDLITSAVDAVVHVSRTPQRRRRIASVVQFVDGAPKVLYESRD
jgi:pilus assembly protein CpaF